MASATYVFCLVQSARRPSLRGVPDSLPGAGAPRLLSLDHDVWAVVADAPLERFSAERLAHDLQDVESISRHALAHAGMIEFFFRRGPVLPLKLFTLFSADAKAREHLYKRRPHLRKLFAELRGLEEWGVRITAGGSETESATPHVTGRDYLEVKKRLSAKNAAPSRATVGEITAALKTLGKRATKMRKEEFPPPGQGRAFVTGASFLVKAKRRNAWKKEVVRLTATLAKRGHRLEVSGPWPPYRFAGR